MERSATNSQSLRLSPGPPTNIGLLKLIRGKQERNWKPTIEERRQGFRGWHQRGYLPHFDAPYVTQMITFGLADALPEDRLKELEQLSQQIDSSQQRRLVEQWFDRGHGHCWLQNPAVASAVENILLLKNGKNYNLQAWVLMPNHVHAVVDVWHVPLVKLLHKWKGASARAANAILGRLGQFWHVDYYDTLIRDEEHLRKAIEYVEQNPAKAFLVRAAAEWKWSSARWRDKCGVLRMENLKA